MPIYECHCIGCDLTFEVLASVGAANKRHACPECGKLSPRVASTFAIVSGGSAMRVDGKNGSAKAAARKPRQMPLCLQNPHIPLLCHMDEPSARRWVAHFNGRGAEYDDKAAERVELRKKRGLPPAPEPQPSGHLHGHEHNPRRHAAAAEGGTSGATGHAEHAHPQHRDRSGDHHGSDAASGSVAHKHGDGGAHHHRHGTSHVHSH